MCFAHPVPIINGVSGMGKGSLARKSEKLKGPPTKKRKSSDSTKAAKAAKPAKAPKVQGGKRGRGRGQKTSKNKKTKDKHKQPDKKKLKQKQKEIANKLAQGKADCL